MPNNCDGFSPTNPSAQERAWMQQVEDRLEQMETQQRLFNSSVKGGAITVYDNDLKQVGRLGVGSYGLANGQVRSAPVLAVSNSENRFQLLIDVEDGWAFPVFAYNWTIDSFIPVTSPSYVNTYKSTVNILGLGLFTQHILTADGGTNGTVKLNYGGIDSDEQTIVGGEQKVIQWAWDLTEVTNLHSVGQIRVQAKRTSGTGNINMYSPDFLLTRPITLLGSATPGGIPQQ